MMKQLSFQDYKDVVISRRTAGDNPNAIRIQLSLATGFVKFSRSWLKEDRIRMFATLLVREMSRIHTFCKVCWSFLEREPVGDPSFYDEVVQKISFQDYKDVVKSLRKTGDNPDAMSIQQSLASAFVYYSRFWLHEEWKEKKVVRQRVASRGVVERQRVASRGVYGSKSPLLQGLLAESFLKRVNSAVDASFDDKGVSNCLWILR
jgi:hypothetical protein